MEPPSNLHITTRRAFLSRAGLLVALPLSLVPGSGRAAPHAPASFRPAAPPDAPLPPIAARPGPTPRSAPALVDTFGRAAPLSPGGPEPLTGSFTVLSAKSTTLSVCYGGPPFPDGTLDGPVATIEYDPTTILAPAAKAASLPAPGDLVFAGLAPGATLTSGRALFLSWGVLRYVAVLTPSTSGKASVEALEDYTLLPPPTSVTLAASPLIVHQLATGRAVPAAVRTALLQAAAAPGTVSDRSDRLLGALRATPLMLGLDPDTSRILFVAGPHDPTPV